MRRTISFILILFLGWMGYLFANRDDHMVPAEGFFLQEGDPEAGRQAFTRLKCSSCHWAANDIKVPDPITVKTGPMLGPKQAAYAPGWIANSIVSPSHTIARNSNGQEEGGKLSRMPDFTQTMTVRELMDLVAYVQSLKQNQPAEAPNSNSGSKA